jgi:hypothetical protein
MATVQRSWSDALEARSTTGHRQPALPGRVANYAVKRPVGRASLPEAAIAVFPATPRVGATRSKTSGP